MNVSNVTLSVTKKSLIYSLIISFVQISDLLSKKQLLTRIDTVAGGIPTYFGNMQMNTEVNVWNLVKMYFKLNNYNLNSTIFLMLISYSYSSLPLGRG